MMRARTTCINLRNEEFVIDMPPAEDRIEHHQSRFSSGSPNHISIAATSLQICASMVIFVRGYALTNYYSHQPPVVFAAVAAVVGFLCSWMAVAVERKKPLLADFLVKIGHTATAVAIVVPMGWLLWLFLPGEFKWLSVLFPVILTTAIFLFG
ncbi:hypothetical protein CDL12_20082 [Handroanthus impetiginosus]|uniref:Uncharacterized protein n=1 Tax=Handroanthus impetiginosus TaxID=429701 RepID=A0A2G9GQ14_9LAMI|nr:hypothetical protein CDL12_20082 [Handroanthus impetiginosus]